MYIVCMCVCKRSGATDLILKEKPTKSPDGTEHKEELVDLLVGVSWCVIYCQESLQEITQGLDHAHFLDGSDHLEAIGAMDVQQDGDVAVKEDRQISLLGL